MSTQQFKPVPEPPESLERVEEARRAVPLVPDPRADCCARLQDRIEPGSRQDAEAQGASSPVSLTRQDAETWLTFLRALELVERKQSGYARTRHDLDRDELAAAFRERVVGADAALDAAAGRSGDAAVEAAFEAVRESAPEWERRRHDDWEAVWRDRTERLLAWGALFGADAS